VSVPAHPRPGFGSRVVVRIYLGCLVGICVITLSFMVVHKYVLEPPWVQHLQRQGLFVTDTVLAVMERPQTLARVKERVQRELQAKLTVYRTDGTVVMSTVQPPLPPLGPAQVARLEHEEAFTFGRPPTIAASARKDGRLAAYGLFIPNRASMPLVDSAIDIGIILIGVAILSLLAARALSRPLGRLAAAAHALGDGDLDARVGLTRSDELGDVGRAFDRMAERLAHLLRAQRDLLGNVSHELRTPLARIRVALDLAEEGDAAAARESLGEITEDLSEIEHLVEDILTAGRLDLTAGRPGGTPPLRREPVDARALLDKAVARFRAGHPERRLELDAADPLPPLDADPALLRRAIDNLVDNARKYSDNGTAITLRARAAGDALIVEVVDEGVGIHPEDLPRVFEPFFRADRSRTRQTGGAGLGLALARGIVEAHGGTIAIESTVGHGTTVRLTVPGAPATAGDAAA
jgi:signal transduction histidine kinase